MFVSSSFSSDLLPFPFVFSEGKADTSLAPNNAVVTFWVKDVGQESSKAMESVEKRTDEIIRMLNSNGIKSENITAYAISKDIKNDYESKEMKILGYEISRRFEVRISDLNLYTLIAQPLSSTDNIDRFSVTFGRSDQDKIDSILLLKACKNARENADQLAKSLNSQVKNLFAISKSGFYTMPAKFGLEEDRISKGLRGTSPSRLNTFMPHSIDIHSEINTIFKLK
jgi:hypothetical protein